MNDAATSARFNNPYGVACDGTNVWITDQGNNNIRRMTVVDRVASTVTGTCTAGTGIAYGGPRGTNNGVVVYAACQLATNQYKIVKYDLDGSAELADFAFYTGVAATLRTPRTTRAGALPRPCRSPPAPSTGVINGIRIGKTSTVSTVGYDTLFYTVGDALGYLTLTAENAVLGNPTTGGSPAIWLTAIYAGVVTGTPGDGAAATSSAGVFRGTIACAADYAGTSTATTTLMTAVYVAETGTNGHRVARVTLHGTPASRAVVRTGAASSNVAGDVNGDALVTRFDMPFSVCADAAPGTVAMAFVVADSFNQKLKILAVSGTVLSTTTTDATPATADGRGAAYQTGNAPSLPSGLVDGNANARTDPTLAQLSSPSAIVQMGDHYYFTDTANHVIRRVTMAGGTATSVIVVAGTTGTSGDVVSSPGSSLVNPPTWRSTVRGSTWRIPATTRSNV